MARLKRSSTVLEKAIRRMDGMRSISQTLDFGNGLSLADYQSQIQTLQAKLSSYNTMLSALDEAMGQIELLETDLSRYSEKMLMGVATTYGKNSLQYVQAGGKQRKSTKRYLGRTTSTPTIAPAATTIATPNGNGATMALN
jgi:uncharacterized protein YukE